MYNPEEGIENIIDVNKPPNFIENVSIKCEKYLEIVGKILLENHIIKILRF